MMKNPQNSLSHKKVMKNLLLSNKNLCKFIILKCSTSYSFNYQTTFNVRQAQFTSFSLKKKITFTLYPKSKFGAVGTIRF